MASKNIKGITIEIGGETAGLEKALKNVNSDLNKTQKNLNEVDKLLKLDPENTELLAQKQRLLSQAIEQTRGKLSALRQAQEKAKDAFEKGDLGIEEYERLQRVVIRTENDLKKLESQARSMNSSFKKVGDAAESLSEKAGKIGDKLQPITVGVLGLASAAVAAVEGTEELRSDLSKLDVSANENAVSAETARDAWREFAVVSDETDSAVEATANLLQAGFTESNLQKAVEGLAGAYLRFPDTLKIESLADSLQETLATGEATGQFSEMLDRLGIGTENFSKGLAKCKTEADKQNYALQTLAKAGLMDTYNGWKEANKELVEGKESQIELQEAISELGATVQPVVTKVVKAITNLVKGFNELDPSTKKVITRILAFSAALSPIAKISSKVVGGVSNVAKSFANYVEVANGAAKGTGLLSKMFATISGGPISGVIAGIAGISAVAIGAITGIAALTANTHKYTNATRELIQTQNERIANVEAQAETDIAEAVAADNMAKRVQTLTSLQSLNNQQKSELIGLVASLNEIYPGLNLKLDEEGKLIGTSAANLKKYTENMVESVKAEAYREIMLERAKALALSEMELADKQALQAENSAKLKQAQADLAETTGMTTQEIAEAYAKGTLWNGMTEEQKQKTIDLTEEIGRLGGEAKDLKESEELLQTQTDNLQSSFDAAVQKMGTSATNMEKTITANMDKAGKSVDNLKKKMDGLQGSGSTKGAGASVTIPAYANGGVLRRGTALVGEEGPELLTIKGGAAVVTPLNQRQRNAVGTTATNSINFGITINNGKFTVSDARQVVKMIDSELGKRYR